MLLEIKDLSKYFGGLTAVGNLDMHVDKGEIVGLIGPNGAGKTTVFNLITGFIHPSSGAVYFDSKDIIGLKPHVIAKLGIGRTFQLNPLFGEYTVLDAIASSFLHPKSSLCTAFLNTSTYRKNERYIAEHALAILELLGSTKPKTTSQRTCRTATRKCSVSAERLQRNRTCFFWTSRLEE